MADNLARAAEPNDQDEQLRRLESLLDDGLLTPDEYATKRAAVLGKSAPLLAVAPEAQPVTIVEDTGATKLRIAWLVFLSLAVIVGAVGVEHPSAKFASALAVACIAFAAWRWNAISMNEVSEARRKLSERMGAIWVLFVVGTLVVAAAVWVLQETGVVGSDSNTPSPAPNQVEGKVAKEVETRLAGSDSELKSLDCRATKQDGSQWACDGVVVPTGDAIDAGVDAGATLNKSWRVNVGEGGKVTLSE